MEAMCLQVRLTNARTNHNGQTQVTPNPRLHPINLTAVDSLDAIGTNRSSHPCRSIPLFCFYLEFFRLVARLRRKLELVYHQRP
ncbi:hypothetical protein MJO29_016079 [Puccinia striiformis f. sp. tritici]|nr:hypothetical protein MJO29_016079 [Puccinia striiformis f. sp. tritici]